MPNTYIVYRNYRSLRFSLHRNGRLLFYSVRLTLDARYVITGVPIIMPDMLKLMLICLHTLLIRLGRIQIDVIAIRPGSGHTMHMSRQWHDPHKDVIFRFLPLFDCHVYSYPRR